MVRIGLEINETARVTITDPALMELERAYQPLAGGLTTNRSDGCGAVPNSSCRNESRSCVGSTNEVCTNNRLCMQRAEDVMV